MAGNNIIETLSLLSQATDKTIEESISKASKASDWFKMISDIADKVMEDELSDELPTVPGLLEYAFEIMPVTKSKRKTSRFSKVTHIHDKRQLTSSSRHSTRKTYEKIEEHQPASSSEMEEKKICLNSTFVKETDNERKSPQNLNLTHRLLTPTQPVVEVLKRSNRKSSGIKVLRKSARSILHAKLSGMQTQKSSPLSNPNKLSFKRKWLKSSVQKENSLVGKVFPKSSNVAPAKISSQKKLISEGNKVLRSKQPSHVQAPKSMSKLRPKNKTASKTTGNPKVEDKKSGILDSQKKNVKQSSKEPRPAIILKIKKNEIVTKQTSNKGKTPERPNKATTAVDSKQKFEPKSATPKAIAKQLSTPAKATKSEIRSVTPARSSLTNYEMTDVGSNSEDEPERETKKPIPSWCIGLPFKTVLISLHHSPMNTDELFGSQLPPDLEDIFNVKNKMYKVRSSSAIWNSPNAFR